MFLQKPGALAPPDEVIRLMLVDDHAVVRAGYKRYFALEDDLHVVAEAATGEEAYELLGRTDVDILLLDLSMPGQGGFETLRRMTMRYPKQKVLALTMHDNPSIARQALQLGACGYLTKSMDPALIVKSIREAWRGHTPLDAAVETALLTHADNEQAHDRLLPREFEIFLLLASGESVDAIAQRLSMSTRTVHNYQAIVRRKLGLRSPIELRQYALAHALINDVW